ncbi:MAG: hypothetical protein EA392_07695 [Cryomorphaceae bacterium]|nr:MAG: hypothetical protein EA392_07695 [Cryomorphaceae bacterium]
MHFGATLVYVSPQRYFPSSLSQWVTAYMAPQFHQTWSLFAPDPPTVEKSIEFRVFAQGEWRGWSDPGAELLEAHDAFRLSQASILFRINQNVAWRLWNDHQRWEDLSKNRTEHKRTSFFERSRAYQGAIHYAGARFREGAEEVLPDSIEVRIRLIPVPPPGGAEASPEFLRFPVYAAR